jgi:cytochrome P450
MEVWLTISLVALSTLLALRFFKLSGGKKQLQPPGPWRLPIIGSLHHIVSVLPHRTMTELCRRHGPVMYLQLGEIPTVVVSSAEAVAEMMKANDASFASRRTTGMQDIVGFGGSGIVFAPYGDHWRQMRKVCVVELLSSKQVKRMDSIRAEEMGNLLRSITASPGATINVRQKLAALSNGVVTRAVFGGRLSQREDFIHAADDIMDMLGGFFLVDLFPSSRLVRWLSNEERRVKSCRDVIQGIITDVVAERKVVRAAGNGTGDEGLLDTLLTLEPPLTTGMMSAVLFVSIFLTDDNDAITSMCLVRTHLSHWLLNYHAMSTSFKIVMPTYTKTS